jgi:hypothetical protein
LDRAVSRIDGSDCTGRVLELNYETLQTCLFVCYVQVCSVVKQEVGVHESSAEGSSR